FDEKRLLWANGQFIRDLTLEELSSRIANFWPDNAAGATDDYKLRILTLVQDRLKTLHDLPMLTSYFFEKPVQNWDLITENKQLKKLSKDNMYRLLTEVRDALSASKWTPDDIKNTLNGLLDATGEKPGVLFSLVRIVTTWAPFSPQLSDTLALMEQDDVLNRIDEAIKAL
ncbi:MAG: glutamate--tRNA ligase, partial [Candidatus Saccharimonadales bacterium]